MPPSDKFYADPILFKYQGINYIFFEDYDYRKGVISYITVNQNLKMTEPRKILELPIHLSFPSIFQEGDDVYMIPETYDNRAITLFKATHFPDQWEMQRLLVEGQKFSDPMLFKKDGYYWLFAAVQGDRLVIYYADCLDGIFHPHPINARSIRGRNAGLVFSIGGRLIRPTMDCRKGYGISMILKEIVSLTPENFREKEIAWIQPTWARGLTGTHSYSQNEDFVVYDGRRCIKRDGIH